MAFAIGQLASAAPQTADLVAHGKSLQILTSNPLFVTGIGNVYTQYSTYRSNGTFLFDIFQGQAISSGELRLRAGSTNLFEGAYIQSTAVTVLDWGTYAVNVPAEDLNGDGALDVLDVSRLGNFVATGSGISSVTNSTFSIDLSVARQPNSATGTYRVRTVAANGTATTTTGDIHAFRYEGSIIYDRADNTLRLEATIAVPRQARIVGNTTFTVNSDSQLSYEPFDAIEQPTGRIYQVQRGQFSRLSGDVYVGDLRLVDGLPETYWPDFTDYRVVVSDPFDHDGDGLPDLTDPDAIPNPPDITVQPSAPARLTLGQVVTLEVTANRADSYQWLFEGSSIEGATEARYAVTVSPETTGDYSVRVSNAFGSVISHSVTIQESIPPVLIHDLRDLSAVIGQPVYLQVRATGPGLTYQWTQNGSPLFSQTTDILAIPSFTSASRGFYRCEIANDFGVVQSRIIRLSQTTGQISKLANLSVRGHSGNGNDVLTGGFVSTDATKSFLMRSVGPALAMFEVTGTMTDPKTILYDAQDRVIAENNDWGEEIQTTADRLGAFALPDASKDAGMIANLVPGAYTAQTAGVQPDDIGVILFEIYDTDTAQAGELTNLSARAYVEKGGSLVVGLVLQGNSSSTVMVRAVGRSLENFDLDPVQDPQLELHSLGATTQSVISNVNWLHSSNSRQIAATAADLGAFALDSSGGDSVVLATLAPGIYTATLSSASGSSSGVALVEFYLVR